MKILYVSVIALLSKPCVDSVPSDNEDKQRLEPRLNLNPETTLRPHPESGIAQLNVDQEQEQGKDIQLSPRRNVTKNTFISPLSALNHEELTAFKLQLVKNTNLSHQNQTMDTILTDSNASFLLNDTTDKNRTQDLNTTSALERFHRNYVVS